MLNSTGGYMDQVGLMCLASAGSPEAPI